MRYREMLLLGFALLIIGAGVGYSSPHPQRNKKNRADETTDRAAYWKKWLNEDVVYIITNEEKAIFQKLTTPEEKESFIEQFWLRRDPDPRTPVNEFKEEHYRRIAYANEHFASGIPGWKTDRGRIYIMWGPPDEKDTHPAGGPYQRPPSEGGGETSTYPFEDWTYHYLPGIGENVTLEFVDPTMTGEYRLTTDPSQKDALLYVPGAGLTDLEAMGLSSKVDRFTRSDGTHMGAPEGMQPESMNEFNRLELYAKIFQPPPVKYKDLEAIVESRIIRNELPFNYRFDILRITDIGFDGDRTAAHGADLGSRLFGRLAVAEEVYGNIRPKAGEVQGDDAPNAAT